MISGQSMSTLRVVSAVCLVLSLITGGSLVLWDTAHGFLPMLVHQRGAALALMLVGASYAIAHAVGVMPAGARLRAISLGLAFVLWERNSLCQRGVWPPPLIV